MVKQEKLKISGLSITSNLSANPNIGMHVSLYSSVTFLSESKFDKLMDDVILLFEFPSCVYFYLNEIENVSF